MGKLRPSPLAVLLIGRPCPAVISTSGHRPTLGVVLTLPQGTTLGGQGRGGKLGSYWEGLGDVIDRDVLPVIQPVCVCVCVCVSAQKESISILTTMVA